MKRAFFFGGATALLFALAIASAQAQGPGRGPASGPGRGMQGMRMNGDNTPGWGMMSSRERGAHRARMMGMTDYATCHDYMEQHRAQMVERAKERRRPAPAQPRRDACAPLKQP